MKKRMILLSILLGVLTLPVNKTFAEPTQATSETNNIDARSNNETTSNSESNTNTITNISEINVPTKTTAKLISKTLVVNDGRVVSGRTLVPLRAISEGLGMDVKWNQKLKEVTIIDGNNKFIFKANSNKVNMNGRTMTIDVPVKIYSGTTYVPLLVVVPQDGKLTWDNKTKTATIIYEHIKLIVNTRK